MTERDIEPAPLDDETDLDAPPEIVVEPPAPEAQPSALARGLAVIREALKTAPAGPGVYRMVDAAGQVLYVGKARSLKKRVASYARGHLHASRLGRMVAETATMEFVVTETEVEALLLEANLIKRLRPRFNVLLRDDKSFPYIVIATGHPAPRIVKHRGARSIEGDYFGPFASVWAVNRTVTALQKAFLLRSCSDAVYDSRTRPCLLFQIKRCSAPCTGEIGIEDYRGLVAEARAFLSGGSRRVRTQLAREMEAAAERLDFETAARYRDRLAALSAIQQHQGINPQSVEEADVFAIHQEAGQTCVQVFFFRTFQNWGNRAYFPRADRSVPVEEVFGEFLAQFYEDRPAPRLVLLSETVADRDLLEKALTVKSGHRVEVAVPRRGERRELVEHARGNAREALGRKLAETSSQARLLAALAGLFGLPAPPRRVEVYDNSHIMGASAVGAMIVAGPEGFLKNQYRKFNIRSQDIAPGDDTGMMREVLHRRFSRLLKEQAAAEAGDGDGGEGHAAGWPDLVLIDGGAGQLAAARAVMDELGLGELPIAGIAKGRDRDAGRESFFLPGREPFRLEPRDPVLYFVQRLRDEAHRFAIGTHRARRARELVRSPLDQIAGIGPARKRALLRHFGTAKGVAGAGLSDLESVPGISHATAKLIYDFFHDGRT